MDHPTTHLPQRSDASPHVDRRDFLKLSAAGAGLLVASRTLGAQDKPAATAPAPAVTTNIDDILKIPRTPNSMPGLLPGQVVRVDAPCLGDEKAEEAVYRAVCQGLLALTGEKQVKAAWLRLVSPKDVIGLKLNPVAGKLLSNNPLVVKAVLRGLKEAGVPNTNLVIWDRRRNQLEEVGFDAKAFPGIAIEGTEGPGPNGLDKQASGRLWALDRIDQDALCYHVSLEGKHDEATLPYMVNEGQKSYFTKLVTQRLTKIINLPVLKNAGTSVTLCMKNLTYGALSNTARLHKIWHRSIAEGCAFPYLRDKVVLNVVDGTRACYDGGPAANAAFIWSPNLLLFGTDPVAVDAIGYDIVIQDRIARGVQKADTTKGREFLTLAARFGLGVADRDKITLKHLKAV